MIKKDKPKILLVIPPFIQMNSVYPSVTYLSGYLNELGYNCASYDLSLNVLLKIFSASGLKNIFNIEPADNWDDYLTRTFHLRESYIEKIDFIIKFLQNPIATDAYKIVKDGFLPEGRYFTTIEGLNYSFGNLGAIDKAKYFSSLVIDDITYFIQKVHSSHFGLSKYAEKMFTDEVIFKSVEKSVSENNVINQLILQVLASKMDDCIYDLVGFSIPFPGNLLASLVAAKFIKENYPTTRIVFGGGYVNTELREIAEKRLFKYCDYLTFDDGELPIKNIIENCFTSRKKKWVRTIALINSKIVYLDNAKEKLIPHNNLKTPSFKGIEVDKYFSMTELLNPMHRLWSDGFWNKILIAHGCYWRKCTFCDITLDYIGRYSPANAKVIVAWMKKIIRQTGKNSFHFVDEAAPPSLLKELSLEIINQKLEIVWWTNIRFEKAFTYDLCRLMSKAGCIAVSGGLEVADDRLLKLINKGISVSQTAIACRNFKNAGIMVHAYLMYGFPTQNELEIINSLELVRQFFKNKLIDSAFWHLFTLTIHSPIAKDIQNYDIKILNSQKYKFANNNLVHRNLSGMNFYKYSKGLDKSLYNYMQNLGINNTLQTWFDFHIPKTTIKRNEIKNILRNSDDHKIKQNSTFIWIASAPQIITSDSRKAKLVIHNNNSIGEWILKKEIADWLISVYNNITTVGISNRRITSKDILKNIPNGEKTFVKFQKSKTWKEIKDISLLII